MTLSAGTRLGAYDILALIGTGGMGEVYKARDSRLGRIVAIKVLRERLAGDSEIRQRFDREAQVIAQLDHPHICTLYDVGDEYGMSFLVMQYLEGETLKDKLAKGPLPLDLALRYGIEITDALDKAHRHGITHRDLKPGNVMLTKGGATLLDFGLAKARVPGAGTGPSLLSTTTLGLTPQGTILGTFQYMAPEQLEGKRVDARTDIFAFGCVLYEMLTGNKAFEGQSQASLMSAILKDEPPPVSTLQPLTPRSLDRVVRKCLAKDPDDRWQSVRDLHDELRWIADARTDPAATTAGAPAKSGVVRGRLAVLGVVIGASALALAVGLLGGMRAGRVTPPVFQQLTFRHGSVSSARFASDGQTIVYGAAWDNGPIQLASTRLESTESRELGVRDADLLAISSSGEMAIELERPHARGVIGPGTVARMPLDASTPREILTDVADADWSPDGQSLAVAHLVNGNYRLEFPVGTVLYETAGWVDHLRVSPDGAYVAFSDHPVKDDDRGTVSVVRSTGGGKQVLSDGWSSVTGLAWSATGDEIWFTAADVGAAASLYAVDLSGRVRAVLRSTNRLAIQDVDRGGRVLLTESTFRLRIGAVDMSGRDNRERDLSWLDGSVATDLSADGNIVVINEQGVGARSPLYAVYLRKTDGSPATRIGEGALPMLSPDGRFVAALVQGSSPSITLLPTGVGQPRTLDRGNLAGYQSVTWYPDGRRVLLAGNEAGRRVRLWAQGVPDGKPTPVSSEGLRMAFPSQPISPDGAQVAVLDQGERVWLHPLSGGMEPRLVEGLEPGDIPIRWHADGQSLYVFRYGGLPATVYRFHLKDRRKEQVAVLTPSDRAGVDALSTVQTTPDGRLFLYTYSQTLSDLFLVTNVQ